MPRLEPVLVGRLGGLSRIFRLLGGCGVLAHELVAQRPVAVSTAVGPPVAPLELLEEVPALRPEGLDQVVELLDVLRAEQSEFCHGI